MKATAPTGMELSDFEIGRHFWTGAGKWVCVKVGWQKIKARKLGPLASDQVFEFDQDDFDGCSTEAFK
jgi:hypothetical protein